MDSVDSVDSVGTALPIAEFVAHLRQGGVVGCATETQMGLLADALDADAVARVCALKGRGDDSPLALLLPGVEALTRVALPADAGALALCARHWPGPLTLLLPARPGLSPRLVKEGRVGVRVPGPSPALQLVRAFGGPLTATSANLSGAPAASTAAQVRAVFGAQLPVLPADAPGGPPSTIVALEAEGLRVLRAGAIPADALR